MTTIPLKNIAFDKIKESDSLTDGELSKKLSKAQNKIDSPEEYARVNAQCKNWEQRLRLE